MSKFKKLKIIVLSIFVMTLTACGSHGYEGTYKMDRSSGMSKMLGAFGGGGEITMVVGSDYSTTNGERTNYDEIFVRESGGKKYLVFKKGNLEEVMLIVNDKTLSQGTGMVSISFKKVSN
jgi:hypothetical protein